MKYVWLFIKTVLRLVLKPLSFVPAIIVMYCIFNFSSQSGVSSAQLSYKVTHKLVYNGFVFSFSRYSFGNGQ